MIWQSEGRVLFCVKPHAPISRFSWGEPPLAFSSRESIIICQGRARGDVHLQHHCQHDPPRPPTLVQKVAERTTSWQLLEREMCIVERESILTQTHNVGCFIKGTPYNLRAWSDIGRRAQALASSAAAHETPSCFTPTASFGGEINQFCERAQEFPSC